MQTSLARRQRHRRNGRGGRTGGGHAAARRVAIALPLALFASFILLGLFGFVVVVGAYGYYSQGLPDPQEVFNNLAFNEQTVIYDSTGKVELARFGSEKREVVRYDELPPILVDATTSIEDKTFWTNAGFDPIGFVKAGLDTLSGNERGASTITQQLVRARLLPASAFQGSKYERKIKEIIQSIRLTQEFGEGDAGKKSILEAYLNQNYYGNQSYGIKAAAKSYFGLTDLSKLTIAQAAILAAIPKSPTAYDLAKNAVETCSVDVAEGDTCPAAKVQLEVPATSEIVRRRNLVLNAMIANRVLTRNTVSDAEIAAARDEPVVLVSQKAANWRAPHFVWQVRKELAGILCGDPAAESCERMDRGGYRVTTTLDWTMQRAAEKWVKAGVIGPNRKDTAAYLKATLKLPDLKWVENLRGKNIHNGALVAVDYRTGEILAYVGSADYYGSGTDKRFQPQFDVLTDGWRQPGSAFKPINYVTGIQGRNLTAASLFMDVVTDFGGGYTPTDADNLERGPVRLREALSFSLNIPAVRAAAITGPDRIFEMAKRFGVRFQKSTNQAGTSIGIGTLEVHPVDLTSAYGALANGGVLVPRRTISSVVDAKGNEIWSATDSPAPASPVVSPQAAFIIDDILASNTDPKQNPFWGKMAITEDGKRRPAALKTGTTNDTKDLSAYGFLAPPEDPAAHAIAVGVWMGNSDNSQTEGVFSLESTAPLWQAFLSEISAGSPIADFGQPDGIVQARIDPYSGMLPGPFTNRPITEYFIDGTVPTQVDNTKVGVDIDQSSGLLWQDGCLGPKVTEGFLDLSGIEANRETWRPFDDNWIARARKGPGTIGGPERTRTSYFYNGAYQPYGPTWGAPFAPVDTCIPEVLLPTPPPFCDPLLGPCPSPVEPQPGAIAVPNLRCLSLDVALEELTTVGLQLGDVKPKEVGVDSVVVSSRPDPGTPLPLGTPVDLTLREFAKSGCG